jgi:hypothetical protein
MVLGAETRRRAYTTHTEDENVAGSPPPLSSVWNACVCSLVLAQLVQHIYISLLYFLLLFERAGAAAGASSKYILFRPADISTRPSFSFCFLQLASQFHHLIKQKQKYDDLFWLRFF